MGIGQRMIMEMKKKYITPEVTELLLNTAEVMTVSEPSDTPTPPGAPAHRTSVF